MKDFIAKVRERAVGHEVLRSITPGQQVIKIVHDCLVEMLGEANETLNLTAVPPVPILMVGLQGSGKTTTTGKIAKRLVERENKRVLMASLDVHRPAAQEQLRVLGEQAKVPTLPIVPGEGPVEITFHRVRLAPCRKSRCYFRIQAKCFCAISNRTVEVTLHHQRSSPLPECHGVFRIQANRLGAILN